MPFEVKRWIISNKAKYSLWIIIPIFHRKRLRRPPRKTEFKAGGGGGEHTQDSTSNYVWARFLNIKETAGREGTKV